MVVCRFFLQGNCKFGTKCKFDHQLNDNYQSNTSILRQHKFHTNPSPTSTDPNGLIEIVVNDMHLAENGKQWLFSCYSPIKEAPCFPGFEDQSFEEVRWSFYEARANGTAEQYYQQLQIAMQNVMMQMRHLQTPTPDVINFITTFYSSSNPNTTFSNVQNQHSTAQSIFATANQKIFGEQQNSSMFARNQFVQQQIPIKERLGGFVNSQSPFAINSQNTSPFYNTEAQPSSINAENKSPFFVMNANVQPHNVPFANSQAAQITQPPAVNIFGSNPQSMNQKTIPQDDRFYSKLEDLSVTDVKIYKSEKFEFGSIPEKPPTKEMCL